MDCTSTFFYRLFEKVCYWSLFIVLPTDADHYLRFLHILYSDLFRNFKVVDLQSVYRLSNTTMSYYYYITSLTSVFLLPIYVRQTADTHLILIPCIYFFYRKEPIPSLSNCLIYKSRV